MSESESNPAPPSPSAPAPESAPESAPEGGHGDRTTAGPPGEPARPGTNAATKAGAASRRVFTGRWVRGRRARWIAAGATVVVVGAVALGAAAAVHDHGERGDVRVFARGAGPAQLRGGGPDAEGRGEPQRVVPPGDAKAGRGNPKAGRDGAGSGRDGGPEKQRRDAAADAPAPAPLPSLAADQALAKAVAAVQDGQVESLRAVVQQGGGSGWLAVVIGPDGVRHSVTVDGASGRITGNTVLDGRSSR